MNEMKSIYKIFYLTKNKKKLSSALISLFISFYSTNSFSIKKPNNLNIIFSTLLVFDQQLSATSFYNGFTSKIKKTSHKSSNLHYLKEYSTISFTNRIHEYFLDIEKYTNHKIPSMQKDHLVNYINSNTLRKIHKREKSLNKSKYSRIKYELIKEWEEKNNQLWPKHDTQVISPDSGEVHRDVGDYYDAHHIIELRVGGPNEWWNLHPARYPDQHQLGIHRYSGVCYQFFEKELERYPEQDRLVIPLYGANFTEYSDVF